jgi:hypothetical protein
VAAREVVESAEAMRLRRAGASRGGGGFGKRRDPARASRPKASDIVHRASAVAHRRHTFMSATSSGSYLSSPGRREGEASMR